LLVFFRISKHEEAPGKISLQIVSVCKIIVREALIYSTENNQCYFNVDFSQFSAGKREKT
jgi:hypothetical protein